MWSEAIKRVLNGTLQMFIQWRFCSRLILILNGFIENRPITTFLDIGGNAKHQRRHRESLAQKDQRDDTARADGLMRV